MNTIESNIEAWLTLARMSVKIELPHGLVSYIGMSFLISLELFMPASDLRHFDLETLRALRQQQRDNLAFLLQTAALVGGEEFANLELRNQLRHVRTHISELESEIAGRETDETPATTSASPPAAPGSAQLRRLIEAAFTADEFEIFCFDYYRPVYSQFVAAMSQTQRIQRLIQYVEGKPVLVQNLLKHLRDANSAAYMAIMTP
jgi:hypothetical protein